MSRREALVAGASVGLGAPAALSAWPVGAVEAPQYALEREADILVPNRVNFHGGKKAIDISPFKFGNAPLPARFIVYDLPPGSSEGVHVHHLDNRNGEGAFDEYYYIVSGTGVMEIDGRRVPVTAGDHIHTPLDVAHGIENTHPSEPLKVFLTYIDRQGKAAGSALP